MSNLIQTENPLYLGIIPIQVLARLSRRVCGVTESRVSKISFKWITLIRIFSTFGALTLQIKALFASARFREQCVRGIKITTRRSHEPYDCWSSLRKILAKERPKARVLSYDLRRVRAETFVARLLLARGVNYAHSGSQLQN